MLLLLQELIIMRKIIVCVAIFSIFLNACRNKETSEGAHILENEDTLALEWVKIDTSLLPCEGDACTSIRFSFPIIITAPTPALKDSLTATINSFALANMSEGYQKSSPQQFITDFFVEYSAFQQSEPGYTTGWFVERDIQISALDNVIFSLNLMERSFLGGAHPNSYLLYVNMDKYGNKLILDSLLTDDWKANLSAPAEDAFREQQQVHPEVPLDDAGYFLFPDGDSEETFGLFQFNDNFLINEKGITFYYNSYEIAAYATGPSSFTLDWKTLEPFIRANSKLKSINR